MIEWVHWRQWLIEGESFQCFKTFLTTHQVMMLTCVTREDNYWHVTIPCRAGLLLVNLKSSYILMFVPVVNDGNPDGNRDGDMETDSEVGEADNFLIEIAMRTTRMNHLLTTTRMRFVSACWMKSAYTWLRHQVALRTCVPTAIIRLLLMSYTTIIDNHTDYAASDCSDW